MSRVALITGGNRGIGLEVGAQLAQQGYRVVLGCRQESRGARALSQLAKRGVKATFVLLDVTKPKSVEDTYYILKEQFGRLDLLVNNAAVHYDSWQQADSVDFEVVEQALQTNTIGPWRVTQTMLPLLRRSDSPRVVNVSSGAGAWDSLSGGTPAYALSKLGLNGLTEMLSRQYRAHGIAVNAVCPGWTATDMGGAGGRPVEDGAKSVLLACGLDSGTFSRDGVVIGW